MSPLSAFTQVLFPLFDAARQLVGTFVGAGTVLLSVAVLLELFWLVYTFYIKGGASEMIGGFFRVILLASVPLVMLTSWPDLPNLLFRFFTADLASLLHGGGSDGTAEEQIGKALNPLFNALLRFLDGPTTANGAASTHWYNVSDNVERAIYEFAAALMLFVPLLLFGIAFTFAMYGPLVMLYIGVIVGPILLPWLVWKPLSNLATRWLTFMLTQGVAFIVGSIFVQIATRSVIAYLQNMAMGDTPNTTLLAAIAGLFPLILVLLFTAFMMMKSESIAAGLVGGASVGAGGFIGGAVMGSRAAKMMSSPKAPAKASFTPGASGSGGTTGAGGTPGSAAALSQGAGNVTAPQGAKSPAGGASAAPGAAPSGGAAKAPGVVSPGSATSSGGGGGRFGKVGKAASAMGHAATQKMGKAAGRAGHLATQTDLGKAAVVMAGAAAGGPVGAVVAGAYAVSPKVRAATMQGGQAIARAASHLRSPKGSDAKGGGDAPKAGGDAPKDGDA